MHCNNEMKMEWCGNEVTGVEWSDILLLRCINSDGTELSDAV